MDNGDFLLYFKVMNQPPKVLGVIGARSGSKRVPNKNIRSLLGKPLFVWMAEAAKKSKYLTKIILSTDSEEYRVIARKYGIEAPFLRPKELADGNVMEAEYLAHAVEWIEKNEGWKPDIAVRLFAPAPLCKTEYIDKCIELLIEDPNADSSRDVIAVTKHPYKMWRENSGYLIPAFDKSLTGLDYPSAHPTQNLQKFYEHTDIIAVRRDTLMKKRSLGEKIKFNVIPIEDAMDIDNEVEFLVAETLLKKRLGK